MSPENGPQLSGKHFIKRGSTKSDILGLVFYGE